METPVRNPLVSAASAAAATSSTVPIRRAGLVCDLALNSAALRSWPRASYAPVSMVPGARALTLIGASSTASPAVTAALVAATASRPGAGFNAVAPDMNRNDPWGGGFPAKGLAITTALYTL